MAQRSTESSGFVEMMSTDAPEQVAAPRTWPTSGSLRRGASPGASKLSNVHLEDVVGSVSRSPSAAGSTTSSSTSQSSAFGGIQQTQRRRRGPLAAGTKGPHVDREAASSIPSERDLYGEHRSHRRGERTRDRHLSHRGTEKARPRSAEQRPSSNQQQQHPTAELDTVDVVVDGKSKGDSNNGAAESEYDDDDDALLAQMQRKEREFDAKIKEIDNTFYSAGRQLVVRDDIIDALQIELAKLRSQTQRRSQAEDQRYREMEKELLDRCNTTLRRVTEENRQLRVALQESSGKLEQRQRTVDQLLQQLTDADAKMREEKASHERRLDKIQAKCQEQVLDFDRKLASLQRTCAEAQADRDHVLANEAQTQAKLLGLQMALSKEKEGDSKAMRELWQEKERLREEVEVVHMSLARLLQVMAEVPALRDYLQWNELGSNFVFLGYPTRYFPLGAHAGDSNNVDLSSSKPNAASLSDRVGTGVEDGIYTGAASFQDSKNIWLNGHWARQLQEIVQAENRFVRLHKIKLYELEEAGQLSDNVPNAHDVLSCRRHDRDYWVPYAIYQEAQNFKNRYYPRIPSASHFYPFLMRLNAIWNGKLQDRIRTLKKDLRTAQERKQQQQLMAARMGKTAYAQSPHSLALEERTRDESFSHSNIHSRGNHSQVSLVGLSRAIATWESQYDHLRREVRIGVTGQRSLQLFKLYGSLFQTCLATVKDLAVQHEQLQETCALGSRSEASFGLNTRSAVRQERLRRRSSRHDYTDYDDGDALDDRGEDASESSRASSQTPPPPPLPRPGRRKGSGRIRRHNDMSSLPLDNTQDAALPSASQLSGVITESRAQDEETIEALLCAVQHSCERVCGVADCLAERTQACCTDLEILLTTLRDVHVPHLLTKQKGAADAQSGRVSAGSAASASSSSAGTREAPSGATSSTVSGPTAASMMAIQSQIRDILRDQYAPELHESLRRRERHTGERDEKVAEETAEAAYHRAMRGMAGDAGGRPGDSASPLLPKSSSTVREEFTGPGAVIVNVVAAALDFSRELREEVLQAQKALQVIAAEVMKEAQAC